MATPQPKFTARQPFSLGSMSFETGDMVPPDIAERPHVAEFCEAHTSKRKPDENPTPQPNETEGGAS